MSSAVARGVLCATMLAAGAHAADLRTTAEISGFKRTGRFNEVEQLCDAFQQADTKRVRCFEFGKSPEGRRLLALAMSSDGVLDARTARERGRTVVLMQGGIHAGEIDGKDAGLLVAREWLERGVLKDAMSRVTFVFVPVFNVDGHERFGPNNRPNQIGPEEMGWRTTAQNLNINRDYIKADSPEMQAMLNLLNEWDPILYVDLHVTDGADFQHDISITASPSLAGDVELRRYGISLRDAVLKKLSTQDSLPLPFYPTLLRTDDPTSGFADTVFAPRFSNEYWGLRNRIGVLVETHSWKNYLTRVRATRNSIVALLELAAEQGGAWRTAAQAADRRSRALAGAQVALAYRNTSRFRTIEFRGYRYTRTPSSVSGAMMTRYDNTQPQIWNVPFYYEVEPSVSVSAPRGGYLVPSAYAQLVTGKLKLHGIDFSTLGTDSNAIAVQTFRTGSAKFSQSPFEGRTTLSVEGEWHAETRDLPAGSLFVPIAQAKSALVMALFEPRSGDSLLSWGFFNTAFERKEYMEAYVAEQVALDMLSKDPALKAEFERKVKEESGFAGSPQARLEFFYRRHASWDDRLNLYPVYRSDSPSGGTRR